MKQPFSEKNYSDIFKTNAKNPELVISRESSTLEFKESFSTDVLNRCMKTIAGYANNEGGYIVFGIKDSPHLLKGLDEKSEQRFDLLDSAKLTESLNNHFAPEIKVKFEKHSHLDKVFGILYVFPSPQKPVICTKTEGGSLRESAIYYRYRGQSREIKYAELRTMLDSEIAKVHAQWMKTIKKIGDSGVAETALLDLKSGKMTGPNSTLYIDEELLNEISFVQEGSFVETGGDPALIVKGQVQTVVGAKKIVVEKDKSRAINFDSIILSFIKQENVDSPDEFIKQIPYQNTGNLPVYYFQKLASLNGAQLVNLIKSVAVNNNPKKLLLRRVENSEIKHVALSKQGTSASTRKRKYFQQILEENVTIPTDANEVIYLLIAMRALSKEQIEKHKDYVFSLMFRIYSEYFNAPSYEKIKMEFRYALCWLDEALYMG
ncbi:ATP-binding protein [Christensenellaceae bacterium OttesenSCG-928-L17]|nr:ATP-binding protein [Christensenellaceae bacterium OttesenSCG-928-L17]